jgi:hypothetical protein
MSILNICKFGIGRRKLLVSTASAATLAMLGVLPALAKPSREIARTPFDPSQFDVRFVVTDRRLPQSLAFAIEHAEKGSARLEVTNGLTRLWQESLMPLWREQGGAVAGLTTREVWHCLAEQARSQSRRTVVLHQYDVPASQPNPLVSWIIA